MISHSIAGPLFALRCAAQLLLALALIGCCEKQLAQITPPFATPKPAPTATVWAAGSLQASPVLFEGRRLFTIAAPIGEIGGTPRVAIRAETIQEHLRSIVVPNTANFLGIGASRYDGNTFRIAIGEERGYPTLYATDASGKRSPPILTLTEADAAFNGLPSNDLAKQWRSILQTALAPAVKARQPEYFWTRVQTIPIVLFAALVLTLICGWIRKKLQGKESTIAVIQAQVDPLGTSDAPDARGMRVSRTLAHAGSWTLLVVTIAAWVAAVLWALSIVPTTRAFAGGLRTQLAWVVGIWLGFIFLNNLMNFLIVDLSNDWVVRGHPAVEGYSRALLRRPTIAGAFSNLTTIVLFLLAIAATLTVLKVSGTSALTVSAVIGFAISLAAQSIIKDYVTGFLILAEDQFAIGDYVTINSTSGFVENLTLRIVQIRGDDGTLVSIANGSISKAENRTSTWSRVDFRIAVSLDSDIDLACEVLQSALDGMTRKARWSEIILEPPQVLGVDAITPNGIILRAWIKTTPMDRSLLARELNRTVAAVFRENRIALSPAEVTAPLKT